MLRQMIIKDIEIETFRKLDSFQRQCIEYD